MLGLDQLTTPLWLNPADSVAQNGLSEDSIAEAFLTADAEFTDLIRTPFVQSPHLATVGSCALVAVLTSQATLYVAGLGDCRAVLGTGSNGRLKAVQVRTHFGRLPRAGFYSGSLFTPLKRQVASIEKPLCAYQSALIGGGKGAKLRRIR